MFTQQVILAVLVATFASVCEVLQSWIRMRVGTKVPVLLVVISIVVTIAWIPSIYLGLARPSYSFFSSYALLRHEVEWLSWVLQIQLLHTALLWLRRPEGKWDFTAGRGALFVGIGCLQLLVSIAILLGAHRWVWVPHILAVPLLGFKPNGGYGGRSMEPRAWCVGRTTNVVMLAVSSALQAVSVGMDTHLLDGSPSVGPTLGIGMAGLHLLLSVAWSLFASGLSLKLVWHLAWAAPVVVHLWAANFPSRIGIPDSTFRRFAFHHRSKPWRLTYYPACVRIWGETEEQVEAFPGNCHTAEFDPWYPWFNGSRVVADPDITIAQLLPHGRRFMESTTQPVMGVQIGFGPEGQRWNGVSMALSSECDAYVSWEDGRWLKSSQQSDDDYRDFCVRPHSK